MCPSRSFQRIRPSALRIPLSAFVVQREGLFQCIHSAALPKGVMEFMATQLWAQAFNAMKILTINSIHLTMKQTDVPPALRVPEP